jgi:hypothetical protein
MSFSVAPTMTANAVSGHFYFHEGLGMWKAAATAAISTFSVKDFLDNAGHVGVNANGCHRRKSW